MGESLGVAPEVLPLAVPSGRSISAASVVSPGMFERALPSEVRPGPRRQTGNSVGPGSTREPSGRVPGSRRPSLDLAEWKKDQSIVLSVTGEVDIATTPQLGEALAAALRFRSKGLVCDLTGVSFLGASGLTALLLVRRRAVACHTWLDLVCPQSLPRKVITVTALGTVFALHDSVAEAVDAQGQRDARPGLTTASERGGMPTAAERGVVSRLSATRRPLSLDVPVRVGDDVELHRVRHVTCLGGVATGIRVD